jgi:hypothetical protein
MGTHDRMHAATSYSSAPDFMLTLRPCCSAGQVVLPLDLLQFEAAHRPALLRAFGSYVIAATDAGEWGRRAGGLCSWVLPAAAAWLVGLLGADSGWVLSRPLYPVGP